MVLQFTEARRQQLLEQELMRVHAAVREAARRLLEEDPTPQRDWEVVMFLIGALADLG
jgi:hypothetical protein